MRTALAAMAWLVLLAGTSVAAAQSLPPQGEPQPGEVLRDDEFGVERDGFGLERRVEMYQWSAGEQGFHRVWNVAPIDSSGFPDNRQNPPELPLDSQRWWSNATLDGQPLDVEVLKALGDWQQFRPSFSRLPGNLSATFQPDGDGLSSSTNPLDPQIGDLRVTWHELQLPPLAGKVELRDGRWQLASPVVGTRPRTPGDAPVHADPDPVRADDDGGNSDDSGWTWLLYALALLALALLVWRWRCRR